ncbi:MAG: sec-independent protein translocase protein TatA [Pseudonocardiales bacterium]|jgi:sec-independent protein translocase protein TatA|nr:sec-independent protein translocase protein TatA [Pseudonocardiales bacterium]
MWDAPWHWVVLALVVIALFGYKKLPEAARSLGRSLRIFRTEIKGMNEDDAARAAKTQSEIPAGPTAVTPELTPPAVPPTDAEVPVDASKGETTAG